MHRDKGLAILAGNVYLIDVTSRIPVLLEEKGLPYMFVPSKFDLGASGGTKRPTKRKTYAIFEEAKAYDPSTVGVNATD
jgi:ribosomal protein L7Ae-like RNA K-turn-binding protein